MKKLTQKEKLLKLLQEAGPIGINSFGVARDIALQLPVRIKELKEQGYTILSIPREDRSVDYILTDSPREDTKVEYTWDFSGNTARRIPKVLESGSGSPKTTASNFENFRQDSLI